MALTSTQRIHRAVRARYARRARSQRGCRDAEPSCFGERIYDSDLSDIPSAITGGSLGCGDPITLARLLPGQIVLDLGSGAGLDCFLAARQVGLTGRVIGVDMTPEMIDKADRNRARLGFETVEFRRGDIEDLPVESSAVDVVISNCVINLSPDKQAVFKEACRVLRPGGRLAVSDLIRDGHIGWFRRSFLEAWSGCLAGAEELATLVGKMEAAGFLDISVHDRSGRRLWPGRPRPSKRIVSVHIEAVKPEGVSPSAPAEPGVAGCCGSAHSS